MGESLAVNYLAERKHTWQPRYTGTEYRESMIRISTWERRFSRSQMWYFQQTLQIYMKQWDSVNKLNTLQTYQIFPDVVVISFSFLPGLAGRRPCPSCPADIIKQSIDAYLTKRISFLSFGLSASASAAMTCALCSSNFMSSRPPLPRSDTDKIGEEQERMKEINEVLTFHFQKWHPYWVSFSEPTKTVTHS